MFKLVMYITMAIAAVVRGILAWRFNSKDIPAVIEGIIIGALVTYILFYFAAFLVCLFATKGYALWW
jgi:hypothetical protein